MARPLSNDLRERVVARHGSGESIRSVGAKLGVAPSTVSKWAKRLRTTGSVGPAKFGGHRRPILEPHRAWIRARLAEKPELTLEGLRAELAAMGVKVSYGAVRKFVHDERLSFKKNCLRQ